MKNFLIFIFLIFFHFSFAGTGGARDEILFVSVIIGILLLLLGILYLIKILLKIVRKNKSEQLLHSETDNDTLDTSHNKETQNMMRDDV